MWSRTMEAARARSGLEAGVRGSSSAKTTCSGTSKRATRPESQERTSCSLTREPASRTQTATGTSP